jgi:hypothetical protein
MKEMLALRGHFCVISDLKNGNLNQSIIMIISFGICFFSYQRGITLHTRYERRKKLLGIFLAAYWNLS